MQPRGDLPLHCYLYCAEHCKEEIVNQLLMAEWKYAPKGVSACKQRSGDGDLARPPRILFEPSDDADDGSGPGDACGPSVVSPLWSPTSEDVLSGAPRPAGSAEV